MRLAGIGCSAALVPVRSMTSLRCRLPGGLPAGVVDAVAGVADGHDSALQVVGGGVGGEGDHVGDRNFDVGDVLGGELECGGQGSGGVVDEPFAGGLRDDAGDLVEGVGAGCFVLRFDAEQ